MLNTRILPRPFSSDRPKVNGYEPVIKGNVTRISRSKRNAWRCQTLVDNCVMFTSHHDTKALAESKLAEMIDVYAKVHYNQI